VLVHRPLRVQRPEALEGPSGLVRRVHHDLVGAAPPDLQTRARGSDRSRIRQWTPLRIELWHRLWRPADLADRELLHVNTEVPDPCSAGGVARQPRVVAVLKREVDHTVDCGSTGEE